MNHAITTGDLLLSLGIIGGFIVVIFGLLMVFAGGMSDAPGDGDATSKTGCIVFIVGVLVLVGCLARLVL